MDNNQNNSEQSVNNSDGGSGLSADSTQGGTAFWRRPIVRVLIVGGIVLVFALVFAFTRGSDKASVNGSLTYTTSFILDESCRGKDKYADLGPQTPVILYGENSRVLDQTELGPGSLSMGADSWQSCRWTFNLNAEKNQSYFIVAIGQRSTDTMTYEELTTPGAIDICMGRCN